MRFHVVTRTIGAVHAGLKSSPNQTTNRNSWNASVRSQEMRALKYALNPVGCPPLFDSQRTMRPYAYRMPVRCHDETPLKLFLVDPWLSSLLVHRFTNVPHFSKRMEHRRTPAWSCYGPTGIRSEVSTESRVLPATATLRKPMWRAARQRRHYQGERDNKCPTEHRVAAVAKWGV